MTVLRALIAIALAATPALAPAAPPHGPAEGPAAPAPTLVYAFTVRVTLAPPVEVGEVDGGRRRFIAITGGEVRGPRLHGTVLSGGGDWQTIMPGGRTQIEAHYFLQTDDGTVIEVTNPGVRTASADVTQQLAKGALVDPSLYYFRTTPSFKVAGEAQGWLQRSVFVARGVRRPDSVEIDFYQVQ